MSRGKKIVVISLNLEAKSLITQEFISIVKKLSPKDHKLIITHNSQIGKINKKH